MSRRFRKIPRYGPQEPLEALGGQGAALADDEDAAGAVQ